MLFSLHHLVSRTKVKGADLKYLRIMEEEEEEEDKGAATVKKQEVKPTVKG